MGILGWVLIILYASVALVFAGHALLNKRNPRSALSWISIILIFPFFGMLTYYLFGINRVRSRARKLDYRSPFRLQTDVCNLTGPKSPTMKTSRLPQAICGIARISDAVTQHAIVGGNKVDIFHNGEETYPAMLESIRSAQNIVYFTTYLFETNSTGRQFIKALEEVHRRGVDVRVIIDGVGEYYGFPRAGNLLKKKGIRVARFLPPTLLPPSVHINLRNHRKILIVDGSVGFTGGMNIGDRYLAERKKNPSRVIDVHFKFEGPVVRQIEQAFLEDWGFVTGEYLDLIPISPIPAGPALCRTIVDGPHEKIDRLETILMGSLASATSSIYLMSPYFLPSRELTAALEIAALRGVSVNIILPGKNNFVFMKWAANNFLWKLLECGIRIYFQPPPFVHSKLLVIDDYYVNIGSTNLDPRGLRLNFELNVEIYDTELAKKITGHCREAIKSSKEIQLNDLEARSLPAQIRDAVFWLFSPYL
jgi:cardiolipin synthase